MSEEQSKENVIQAIEKEFFSSGGTLQLSKHELQTFFQLDDSVIDQVFETLIASGSYDFVEESVLKDAQIGEIHTRIQMTSQKREEIHLKLIPSSERLFIEILRALVEKKSVTEEERKVGYAIEDNHVIGLSISNSWDFSHLPPSILHLTYLKELLLLRIKIKTIPSIIFQLSTLENLDLRGNEINSISGEIKNLINLKCLNLMSNKFENLPESLGELPQLEELNLSYNYSLELSSLTPILLKLQNLRVLNISSNRTVTLPSGISQLVNLEVLDIGHCDNLSSLPTGFSNLEKLRELNMSMNNFSTIPPSILNFKQIKHLNLSYQHDDLTIPPNTISRLTKLENLNLSHNKLVELPEDIGKLTKLEVLNLYSNRLSSLPKSITKLNKLVVLHIGNQRGGPNPSLPADFDNLINLQSLNLRGINLSSSFQIITELKKLRYLNVSACRLESLSDSICQLLLLETLNLSSNYLTELPESITQLKHLKELNLSENEFKILPKSIENWLLQLESNGTEIQGVSLKRIKAFSTLPQEECQFLEELESEIGLLSLDEEGECYTYDNYSCFEVENNHVTKLYVNNHSLTIIPKNIGQLTKLKELGLISREISSLPECMTQLMGLERIHFGEYRAIYHSYSRKLRYLPEVICTWLLELEQNGCIISGLSMARIHALRMVPPKEKRFIERLETFVGLLPLEADIENDHPDAGGTQRSFFSVENNHITKLRVKNELGEDQCYEDYQAALKGIESIFIDIECFNELEELTIAGYDEIYPGIQRLILEAFPDKYTIKYILNEGWGEDEIWFFSSEENPNFNKYWGGFS